MNMNKIIEWIKSLFKRKETEQQVPAKTEVKQVNGFKVTESKPEIELVTPSFMTVEEIKPKKRKRGRPRKKKVEQK